MAAEDKQRPGEMGSGEGHSPSAMQRGQGGHCEVCGSDLDGKSGGGRLAAWRTKRAARLAGLCLLLLTVAVCYAVAAGQPIPQMLGQVVTVLIHAMMGMP